MEPTLGKALGAEGERDDLHDDTDSVAADDFRGLHAMEVINGSTQLWARGLVLYMPNCRAPARVGVRSLGIDTELVDSSKK